MPFDQSTITQVNISRDGTDLLVTWASISPPLTFFQLYVNRHLSWSGQALSCHTPYPSSSGGPIDIEVGTVLPGEVNTDFSSLLPPPQGSGEIVSLSWIGGSYEGADLAGFYIYRSSVSGGPVSYTAAIATVPAYIGVATDGFGMGGFGGGGFGAAPASYAWNSDRQSPGIWTFAVCPFDTAGNVRTPGQTRTVVVTGPPRSPAPFSDGLRVHKTYSFAAKAVTLAWNAPPP
jgi:hypothetical protein